MRKVIIAKVFFKKVSLDKISCGEKQKQFLQTQVEIKLQIHSFDKKAGN